ncbi:MAG: hypothetical protein AAFP97_12570 [Pseudomonadota bacterium]
MRLILRETAAPALALFASVSTLLCCALPALLITIGAGAVMAGLVSNVPGYVWLTERKIELFVIAGVLLAGATWARWATRNAPCPADPKQAKMCSRMRKVGGVILWLAVAAYLIGGFFAFFAADLLL